MTLSTLVDTYVLSDETQALVQATDLLLVAGVVGGGKNTVINELVHDSRYHLIISHTTRSPRDNHGVREQDGIDYHFVDREHMQRLVTDREFAEVKEVHGNFYATSAAELHLSHEANKIAVTDIDIKGVVEYLDIKPDTHAIFLIPPSVDTWLHRLERRYGDLTNHREEIDTRFRTARDEISYILKDRRFILVVNDDLPTTVERIAQIVSGEKDHTSDYAYSIAEHLLEYIDDRLAR